MTMDNTRDRQLGALAFCGFSVPAVMYLPQAGWEAVLPVVAGIVLVVTFGKPVVDNPGKLLALPLIIWNVLIMGKLAREIGTIFGTQSPLPGLLLLLVGAYAAKKRTIPTVGAVTAFFLIGIYGIMYLFAVPDLEPYKLIPSKEENVLGLAYGFMPLLLLYMYKENEKKQKFLWMGAAALLALGAAVITEGMGAEDFYTASKSVNLFGTMERLEPFVASAVTAGGSCTLGIIITVNERLWDGIQKEKKKYPIEFMILPSLALCIMAPAVPERIWTIGTTLCWGLIPIITQFVVSKKKV